MRYNKSRRWTGLLLGLSFLMGCSTSKIPEKEQRKVIVPAADGTSVLTTEHLTVDISNLRLGYLMVCYTGQAEKLFVQLTGPDQTEYKYFMEPSQQYVTVPMTAGEGEYYLCAYENIGADQYSPILSQMLTLELENEFGPYLCSNQYVDFTMEDEAIIFGKALTEGIEEDLEKVQEIYHWVIQNIEYDYQKAETVDVGYLPDIDHTLKTGKGICFDYAAMMSAMLRSQGIPTKLEIGYLTPEVYHSWISVYLDEIGWVDNLIEFNGTEWELMDPTVASSSGSKEVEKLAAEEDSYLVRYVR